MKLTSDQQATIDDFIFNGSKLFAIREYRRLTGVNLQQAESAIETRTQVLSKDNPHRFPKKPSWPNLDPTTMHHIY